MTDRQIILSAFKKAFPNKNDIDFVLIDAYFDLNMNKAYYVDIFDHRFAKAFWGEEEIEIFIGFTESDGEEYNQYDYKTAWQYHLQQMVLEENPLKYLEKFLDETISSKAS